ncbi:FAD-dependent oxidoreductase [Candidatus Dependentiae bacterium]|nr:FAD-dependent oxidoreductase [Candidatus Dependentiae bacterium]
MNTKKVIQLTPPQFSPEHIKEKIVCIRAHRERIFEVSTQIRENKLICHNYGQGGAGWTFLFGCVNESIRQLEHQLKDHAHFKDKPLAIIGAGCYGLLTAILLARKGHQVHIIAKETEDIASYKAAGFFFPRARKSSTPQEIATFTTLGLESYKTYKQIIAGEHPFIKQGPKLIPAYYGLDIDPGFAPYIEQGLIDPPEKVSIAFGNGNCYDVFKYTTLFINAPVLMQELQKIRIELGIPITQVTLDSFDDVNESIVFNCAGLGAKELTSDKRIVPVQGHLITLKNQPNLDELQYMINVKVTMTNALGKSRDELIYFAPKESGILGITFIRGQDSLTANMHEFDRILERCHYFFGK